MERIRSRNPLHLRLLPSRGCTGPRQTGFPGLADGKTTSERERVNGSPRVKSAPERHPILRHLVSLGPRVAGEDSEREAAVYVASAFRDLGLETQLEPFTFVGWRQTTPARVTVHAPRALELPTAAMAYTDSTPPEGVTGDLHRIGTSYILPGVVEWPIYAVVDERGKEVAYVLRRAGG